MQGSLRRSSVFAAVLVLGLLITGVSYASWREQLNIVGIVDTGELKIEFVDIVASDNDPPEYDVGKINCTLLNDDRTLKIEILYAYPLYEATISFKVKNTGTIPATIYNVEYDDGIPYWAKIDFDQLINLEDQTLTPNEWRPGNISIYIYENDYEGNPCQENYSFDFSITIYAKQWNS